LEIGGGKIKRHALLAILVFSIAVIGFSAVSAADPIAVNNTTSDNAILNKTHNQTIDQAQPKVSQAAAKDPPVMKGYWMFSSDAAKLNPTKAAALKNKGITDVFVCTRDTEGNYHYKELQNAITQLHPYGINVHAWIVVFKDKGHFINPSGYYSYTVPVYVKTTKHWGKIKTAYKVKKKVWYKSRGKWRYTWKYVTRYKYKKGWIYTPVYRNERRTGYDPTYNNQLVNEISDIAKNYDVDGIHLDYVRYSGVTKSNDAAYQQPGGVPAAVDAVTTFVRNVRGAVDSTNNLDISGKPYVQLSAALMPEATTRSDNGLLQNVYYYGQDYNKLSNYLDFLVPMTYEGNYNEGNSWITKMTSKIVNLANGKPVYSGLMTYDGDDHPNTADSDLSSDVQAAKAGGAAGYVLFRYDIGSSEVPSWT